MPVTPSYTPAMLESAIEHFHNRAVWQREQRAAGIVILFESSRTRKDPMIYRANEESCNCPGFDYHGGMCSHVLAVKLEAHHLRTVARQAERQSRKS